MVRRPVVPIALTLFSSRTITQEELEHIFREAPTQPIKTYAAVSKSEAAFFGAKTGGIMALVKETTLPWYPSLAARFGVAPAFWGIMAIHSGVLLALGSDYLSVLGIPIAVHILSKEFNINPTTAGYAVGGGYLLYQLSTSPVPLEESLPTVASSLLANVTTGFVVQKLCKGIKSLFFSRPTETAEAAAIAPAINHAPTI